MVVNEQGFDIQRDSREDIEATARVSRNMKFTFRGRLTFERKVTARYGPQIIISLWLEDNSFPILEVTPYRIDRGRIEICVPEAVAKRMKLTKEPSE